MILGHHVEYRGSVSRLPVLVLEFSKGGHLKWGICHRGLNFGFFWRKKLMKMPKNFKEESHSNPNPTFCRQLILSASLQAAAESTCKRAAEISTGWIGPKNLSGRDKDEAEPLS